MIVIYFINKGCEMLHARNCGDKCMCYHNITAVPYEGLKIEINLLIYDCNGVFCCLATIARA